MGIVKITDNTVITETAKVEGFDVMFSTTLNGNGSLKTLSVHSSKEKEQFSFYYVGLNNSSSLSFTGSKIDEKLITSLIKESNAIIGKYPKDIVDEVAEVTEDSTGK